ncbi:MAG: hypothetical protein GY797_08500 [Deltaproteobacteria bacterium]|nr:hypothetical protein [Deltaproteobacteria bacterium]
MNKITLFYTLKSCPVFGEYYNADNDSEWVEGFLIPSLGVSSERIITKEGFRPGADKITEFERAVTSSRYTLLILSPAFVGDAKAMSILP